jgi:hypothetical protein
MNGRLPGGSGDIGIVDDALAFLVGGRVAAEALLACEDGDPVRLR